MQSAIFFITLLIGVCHGTECDEPTSSPDEERYYPCGRTAPIEEACVRNYLVTNDGCTPASHQDGDPVYMPHMIAYIPNLNATIDCTNVKATYFGSKILAFYYNKIAKKLLLAVDFQGLGMESPKAYLYLARTEQEPLEVEYTVNVTYSATLTAYGPLGGLDNVIVSAYNTNPFPNFDLGPSITQSEDPAVQNLYQKFICDLPTVVQELFLTKAYYYLFGYLQKYLCNYSYEYSGDINRY